MTGKKVVLTTLVLAVALILGSGTLATVAAQQNGQTGDQGQSGELGTANQSGVQGQSGELGTANQLGVQGQSGELGTASASARINAARASLQGIALSDRGKLSSKVPVDVRQRGGSKVVERKADWALDTQPLR